METSSKSLYVGFVIALFCAALGLMLFGCAGLGPVQSKTITLQPAVTNVVAVVVEKPLVTTNLVTTITTDSSGKPKAITIPMVATNIVTFTNFVEHVIPAVTYRSNYIASPYVAAAQTVGEIAPVPWAGTAVSGVLALSTLVLGWVNRRNAAKAVADLSKLDEARIVGETLVENFESLRKAALTIPAYQTIDHKVMDSVKAVQRLSGVKDSIASIVENRTENTL